MQVFGKINESENEKISDEIFYFVARNYFPATFSLRTELAANLATVVAGLL